jgi:hypothetical protein
MFLFKLVKGFIKLIFSLVIGLVLTIWLISAAISYFKSGELPYQDMSYMITAYEKNSEDPRGTWSQCPVCDKYYYKDDSPCCSRKCEKEYREMLKAWNSANKERRFIENHGKKFK